MKLEQHIDVHVKLIDIDEDYKHLLLTTLDYTQIVKLRRERDGKRYVWVEVETEKGKR